MNESVLMIADQSGRWESCARSLCAPGHELILLAQPPGESPHEFRKRVTHKLDWLQARDLPLTRIIVVAGPNKNARLLKTLRVKVRDRNIELTSL